MAELIGELQRTLGVRGCRAVGNSLGGYLCMRLALADPGAFSRLVNIHSPAFPIFKIRAMTAALSVPGTHRLLAWWIRRAPLRWVHKNVHYYDETLKSVEEAHEYGDPLATEAGVRGFIHYLTDTMSPRAFGDFDAQLEGLGGKFPIPLLLLYSRLDPLVPPETGAKLHALLSHEELVWLDETSHFAHVDTPEKVVEPVLRFLGAVG